MPVRSCPSSRDLPSVLPVTGSLPDAAHEPSTPRPGFGASTIRWSVSHAVSAGRIQGANSAPESGSVGSPAERFDLVRRPFGGKEPDGQGISGGPLFGCFADMRTCVVVFRICDNTGA